MTQRIASGVVDQSVYFSAPPGITGHTVDRSRDGSAFAAMTTPTVTELGSDGDYALLLDEDMTIGASNKTEALRFKVKAAGMSTTRIDVELYDAAASAGDVNVTQVNGVVVTGSGTTIDPWGP